MTYLYLDTSVRRLFKQKYSPADLMHSHISKSDHSAPCTIVRLNCFVVYFYSLASPHSSHRVVLSIVCFFLQVVSVFHCVDFIL